MTDEWWHRPPMSPTERLRVYGSPAPDPSTLLKGPDYDVRAHYARVKALYDAYPFNNPARCESFTDTVMSRILEQFQRLPNAEVTALFRTIIDRIFCTEGFYRPYFGDEIDNPPTPTWINTIVRPSLVRQEHFFTTCGPLLEQMRAGLVSPFVAFLHNAPESAFQGPGQTTVPLIHLMQQPASVVDLFVSYFFSEKSDNGTYLFPITSKQLWKNLYTASGYSDEKIQTVKDPKLVFPADSDAPLSELVIAYHRTRLAIEKLKRARA